MTPTTAGLTRDLIVTDTHALTLPGVARTFEALARQAREAHWPYEDYLLTAYIAAADERLGIYLLDSAIFPRHGATFLPRS
jgi:hypothetical protein